MKKLYTKILLAVIAIFLLSACGFMPTVSRKELDKEYVKKTEAEAKVTYLKELHGKDLENNTLKLSETKDKVIVGQDNQIQAAADALYTVQQATQVYPAAGAVEFTKDRAVEGFVALGRPPTIKEIIEGGARLRTYLTSYGNSDLAEIAKLREEHDRLVAENGLLVKKTEDAKNEVAKIIDEKAQIQAKHIDETAAANQVLNTVNNKVIEKEKERADAEKKRSDHAAEVERHKRQIMIWCGIGAMLCLAGAVYSPVGKGGLATIAAVLGVVTVSIPFIEAWMVLTIGLVGLGVATGVVLYKYNKSEKANDNIINAIEDTKTKPNATVEDLKSNLKQWNTNYVKTKSGEIIEVTDKAVEAYITEKLAKYGRLDTKKKVKSPWPPPTPPAP